MRRLQILAILFLILGLASPGYADQAKSAYKRGVHAESENNYDAAYEAYKEAHDLKPRDAAYLAAYVRLRMAAAAQHVHTGQALRDSGKLAEAAGEFQRAVEIDPSNFVAQQELRRSAELIKKQELHQPVHAAPESPLAQQAAEIEGPIQLQALSDTPINLRMSENADLIYKIVGKLAGINVLFDPDYKPQRVSIELNDVTAREALNMLALQSKTFWQPVSTNTILVAADTQSKRKDLQDNVMKTFYLRNISTTSELQEAASTVKGILDLNRVQLIPSQNAIILRGTADQMVLAEKLFTDIDKAKGEVVIDIAVMQVSRDRIRTMGVNPPTSASIVMVPSMGGANASGGGNQFTLNSLGSLTANNFLVTIPGATLSYLMSDSNTKVIQNPEIRALDNEKATLKIGDRVPVATGSFAPGIGGAGISPLVNTQFQYLDVGVNIDIVPHIHSEDEVTLKMVLEISSVTGSENIGGVSQPIIGQRRIEHETRLRDGDVNLIGGILEDSETQSLSGYPWLTKVPILKYLFGQEDKERRENEIVFAITPHIVRAQDLTDQNLRMVDIGTGSTIELHHKDSRAARLNGAPSETATRDARFNKSNNFPVMPVAPSMPVQGNANPPAAPKANPWSPPAAAALPVSPPQSRNPIAGNVSGSPPPTAAIQSQPQSRPMNPAVNNVNGSPAAPVTPAQENAERPVVPAASRVSIWHPVPTASSPAPPAAQVKIPGLSQPNPTVVAPVSSQTAAGQVKDPKAAKAGVPSPAATAAARSSTAKPKGAHGSSQPTPQALADPCPFGQHAVDYKKDVVYCAFD